MTGRESRLKLERLDVALLSLLGLGLGRLEMVFLLALYLYLFE